MRECRLTFSVLEIYTRYIYRVYRHLMKFALLALLAQGPAHGYELKQAFEDLFHTVHGPLNAGQIYTTLSRLERDGLVQNQYIAQEGKPDKRVYELTTAGSEALASWFGKPVTGPHLKDEFFMKLTLARVVEITSVDQLIERQRSEYLQTLHELNELMMGLDAEMQATSVLLVKGAILHLKADLEWLDLCEEAIG